MKINSNYWETYDRSPPSHRRYSIFIYHPFKINVLVAQSLHRDNHRKVFAWIHTKRKRIILKWYPGLFGDGLRLVDTFGYEGIPWFTTGNWHRMHVSSWHITKKSRIENLVRGKFYYRTKSFQIKFQTLYWNITHSSKCTVGYWRFSVLLIE